MNTLTTPLPKPVIAKDITPRKWDAPQGTYFSEPHDNHKYTSWGGNVQFDIWFTERFGWVIPCLFISKGKNGNQDRNYAVCLGEGAKDRISKGDMCRVGKGPHVKATHTVTVRTDRLEALQPLLDLMLLGQEQAGDKRDHISTARMNSRSRRGFNLFGL